MRGSCKGKLSGVTLNLLLRNMGPFVKSEEQGKSSRESQNETADQAQESLTDPEGDCEVEEKDRDI